MFWMLVNEHSYLNELKTNQQGKGREEKISVWLVSPWSFQRIVDIFIRWHRVLSKKKERQTNNSRTTNQRAVLDDWWHTITTCLLVLIEFEDLKLRSVLRCGGPGWLTIKRRRIGFHSIQFLHSVIWFDSCRTTTVTERGKRELTTSLRSSSLLT